MNNFIKYNNIYLIPIKILSNFEIKELVNLLRINKSNLDNFKVINILIISIKDSRNKKLSNIEIPLFII